MARACAVANHPAGLPPDEQTKLYLCLLYIELIHPEQHFSVFPNGRWSAITLCPPLAWEARPDTRPRGTTLAWEID